jgi:hypothetical protein
MPSSPGSAAEGSGAKAGDVVEDAPIEMKTAAEQEQSGFNYLSGWRLHAITVG